MVIKLSSFVAKRVERCASCNSSIIPHEKGYVLECANVAHLLCKDCKSKWKRFAENGKLQSVFTLDIITCRICKKDIPCDITLNHSVNSRVSIANLQATCDECLITFDDTSESSIEL